MPQFDSQEAADQWLEDRAKEMGVQTEPTVPFFISPEEAEEWLERQAGEPYVPKMWKTSDGTMLGSGDTVKSIVDEAVEFAKATVDAMNDAILKALVSNIVPSFPPIEFEPGVLTEQTIRDAVTKLRQAPVWDVAMQDASAE